MDARKLSRKGRSGNARPSKQEANFSGDVIAKPRFICPPPPPPQPNPFHSLLPHHRLDYNASVLGVQMSLQVLDRLPSPLLSPSDRSQHRCCSTGSSESEYFNFTPGNPSVATRPETVYFPVVAIATTASQSRDIWFRPSPEIAPAPSDLRLQDPKELTSRKCHTNDASTESVPVSTNIDPPDTALTAVTTAVAVNRVSPRSHGQAKPGTIPITDHPLHVIVGMATTASDNVSNALAEKGGSGRTKITKERSRRMSLRPSLLLNALRSGQHVLEESPAMRAVTPLPNGVIKSLFTGSTTTAFPENPPLRRMTLFSNFLRASNDVVSGPNIEATLASAAVDSDPGQRVFFMDLLGCCCCCNGDDDAGGRTCGRAESGAFAGANNSPMPRDLSTGGTSDHRSRGDYANLIENHRLARLVTLLAVLTILGLVFTYIIKSIVEQRHPLARNSSQ